MRQRALNACVLNVLAMRFYLAVVVVAAGVPQAWAGDVPAQSVVKVPNNGRNAEAGGLTDAVVSWFERAGREYQDSVVDRLAVPTGRGSAAFARSRPSVISAPASSEAPGIVAKLRDLLSLGTPAPIPPHETLTSEGVAAADRLTREIEARKREQVRYAEEQRIAAETRRALATVDRATVERQKLAETARLAEELRRSARPSEVAAAPAVEPRPSPPAKSTPTAAPPTVAQAVEKSTVDAAVGRARGVENVTTPKDTSTKSKEFAQTAPAVKPEIAMKRAPRDAPQQPVQPDAALPDAKVAAARLADSAAKADAKALAKAQKPSRSLASVANDDGNPASRRMGGRSKRCGASGRLVESTSIYVVKSGDTLWDISRRYYDRGSAFGKIVRANEARLSDPDLIFPCQKVYLPGRHALMWADPGDDIDPS
jgi:hypothetical protein